MSYTTEQKAAFDRAMEIIRGDSHPASFATWFRPISLYSVTDNKITLSVDDAFVMQNLRNRYTTMLFNVFAVTFGGKHDVEICLADELRERTDTRERSMLNPRFTFDNFVVGPSNRLAHATALAVAENPGDAYNPLLIYGGVGLGKTHLMNAIGNYIAESNPDLRVLFITSETFTNELVEAIMKKKGTAELRARMRGVDVLMVDDIQFLGKTVTTQEEFFHTFNELYQQGKQIIMSSDRNPKDIPTIEDRLRSRFEWGIIVDIQKPDFETRIAILRKKAESEMLDVPYDVVEYIAEHATSNVREMEGMLNRLDAQSKLFGQKITLDFAREALGPLVSSQSSRAVTPQSVIQVIAQQYGVTEDDIVSSRRSREISLPRQIAMYITRELTQLSTVNIGKEFGGRDHTTVMHGCEKIQTAIKGDADFRKRIDDLMEMIKRA